jgi:hypothetical protein
VHCLLLLLFLSISSSPIHGWPCCCSLKKKRKKRRKKKVLWRGEKEEKEQKKKERIDDVVGQAWTEEEKKWKKYSVFGLRLFWCNFLLFADVLVRDWRL